MDNVYGWELMIVLKKINESVLQVICDNGIAMELAEQFTFEVPGARFMPLYKKGIWDGKIRMVDPYKCTAPLGLADKIGEFAAKRGYKFVNEIERSLEFDLEAIGKFVDELDITLNGNPMVVRDYQRAAVLKAFEKNRGVILSPTGSGKSAIIYLIIRNLILLNLRTVLIVPTTNLVDQMYTDFEEYSLANGWNVDSFCQRLYSGLPKEVTKPVLISTWQSLQRIPQSFYKANNIDAVLTDECIHPDTLITMADNNKKRICDIVIGDMVKAFDEKNKLLVDKPVINIHHNLSKHEQMYLVEMDDGSSVRITGNHKVLLTSGAWKRVDDLEIGEMINGI